MENDRKDDRKDDTDERRKGNGSRERKTVSVDGRLLRPCVLVRFLSIRRLTAAERDLHMKNGSAREWSRRMMRESDEGRAREIRMTRREVYRRELESITQDGTVWMPRERNREKRREEWREREIEEERKRSHSGRMTGLLRRGEESGGYDRRRVQIITIIIFPGNMAAERGWPPGVRVGGKREEERESEIDRERERRREEAGRR